MEILESEPREQDDTRGGVADEGTAERDLTLDPFDTPADLVRLYRHNVRAVPLSTRAHEVTLAKQ